MCITFVGASIVLNRAGLSLVFLYKPYSQKGWYYDTGLLFSLSLSLFATTSVLHGLVRELHWPRRIYRRIYLKIYIYIYLKLNTYIHIYIWVSRMYVLFELFQPSSISAPTSHLYICIFIYRILYSKLTGL